MNTPEPVKLVNLSPLDVSFKSENNSHDVIKVILAGVEGKHRI